MLDMGMGYPAGMRVGVWWVRIRIHTFVPITIPIPLPVIPIPTLRVCHLKIMWVLNFNSFIFLFTHSYLHVFNIDNSLNHYLAYHHLRRVDDQCSLEGQWRGRRQERGGPMEGGIRWKQVKRAQTTHLASFGP